MSKRFTIDRFDLLDNGEPVSVEEARDLLNNYEETLDIIKTKLINQILNYGKIGYDNYNMGLSESVEAMIEEVEDLFKNPHEFNLLPSHYQCWHFKEDKKSDYGLCRKFSLIKNMWEDTDCEEFEWK